MNEFYALNFCIISHTIQNVKIEHCALCLGIGDRYRQYNSNYRASEGGGGGEYVLSLSPGCWDNGLVWPHTHIGFPSPNGRHCALRTIELDLMLSLQIYVVFIYIY